MEAPAGPRVGEDLVAEMQEAVLRELRGRSGNVQFGHIVAAIAGSLELPRSGEEAHKAGELDTGVRFVEVNVAIAEAITRLIGLGFVVPVYATAEPYVIWPIVTANSSGSWTAEELRMLVPHELRLSSAGASWLETGQTAVRNPDLYLRDLPAMGHRVRDCLREAVNAYRYGLPLATVILLGAASGAAWREVGSAIVDPTSDEDLRGALGGGAAAVQEATYQAIVRHHGGSESKAGKAIRSKTESYPDWLRFLARFYSELRNYAAHEDVPPLPIDLDVAATLLRQAHDYFAALYRLPEAASTS